MKDKEGLDSPRRFVYIRDVQNASEAGIDSFNTTFYSVAEAAKILQIDTRTILRAIASGKLRAIRFGGKAGYRITDEQLRKYLDLNLTTGGTA